MPGYSLHTWVKNAGFLLTSRKCYNNTAIVYLALKQHGRPHQTFDLLSGFAILRQLGWYCGLICFPIEGCAAIFDRLHHLGQCSGHDLVSHLGLFLGVEDGEQMARYGETGLPERSRGRERTCRSTCTILCLQATNDSPISGILYSTPYCLRLEASPTMPGP